MDNYEIQKVDQRKTMRRMDAFLSKFESMNDKEKENDSEGGNEDNEAS